jgi:Meiotically up-regulated gene 113
LQRALHKDEAGRRITDPVAGPLFGSENVDGDQASGVIYVLRSKSDHPLVAANRDVLHKIGVTGGNVGRRFVNAKLDPTFLMADVEVVATYELYNINRTRLENLIHRIFDAARLDIEIKDRFGQPVIPREWFLVPLFVVSEAV